MGSVLLCFHDNILQESRNRGYIHGKATKSALRLCPRNIWKIAIRKLDQLDSVLSLDEPRTPPGNRLELLSGDRQGQYSIRINDQYRVCFEWTQTGPSDVEIAHYQRMEEVIENYGLAKMMDEVADAEQISVHEAKHLYRSLKQDVEG